MIPVVLSGGSGTRLWPLSRSEYPKQFLPLVSNKTMLQETLNRLNGILSIQSPIIICNENHRFILLEQLGEINIHPKSIILEPMGKNTAPAVTLAALAAKPDDVLLILPADHDMKNVSAFQCAIHSAEKLAQQDFLVTFGIHPTHAETGYGYIKCSHHKIDGGFLIDCFVEKPDGHTATQYIESGDYFWNSGIFAFKASSYLHEIEKFNPEMLKVCKQAFVAAEVDHEFIRLNNNIFEKCPSDSIDYAVMEKTTRAMMVPLDAGWSDVGSWSSLWESEEKDETGNIIHGDVLALDCQNSYIRAEKKLVTCLGLNDVVVIETDDVVMIAHKDSVQNVKIIVDKLKKLSRCEIDFHRKNYRPWGSFDAVDMGDRHKTKRLVVKPGAKLSLQMHHHRAEHWIVVKGTALVTKGDEQFLLTENESTFIPLGIVHRLENPGVIPLEIIEVQSGSYLEEDDIVRISDGFGRASKK